MSHYGDEYNKWYNELNNESLVFGDTPTYTTAVLPSLEGVLEVGVGKTDEEAKADYIMKLEGLIQELQTKLVKIQYDVVSLEYAEVKGDF